MAEIQRRELIAGLRKMDGSIRNDVIECLAGPVAEKKAGSIEWAWQMAYGLIHLYEKTSITVKEWKRLLGELEKFEVWKVIPPEKPYGSWDAMMKDIVGVGKVEADLTIQERAEKAEPLARHGEIGRGRDRVDGIKSKGGDQASYLTSKIARDAPEVLERMKAGEFKSVAAAARVAGVKSSEWRPTFTLPFVLEAMARTLKKRLNRDEFRRLVELLIQIQGA